MTQPPSYITEKEGKVQSHNAIEQGETKVVGAGPDVGTVERKTAPLPEGLDEVKDGIHSGGGSVGIPPRESGKGGHEPHHPAGENTGLGT